MWMLIIVALLASNAVACQQGCYEYNGICACDQKPVVELASYAKPSDETPPKDKMPSYQREGIHADDFPSMAAQIVKEDEAKAKADAEGKRAAGIN